MARHLIIAAAALLAACGGDNAETPAPAADTVPAAPKLTLAELPAPYNEANLENGRAEFIKCQHCHTLGAGQDDRVGPNLYGLFDRHPGSSPKFRYSNALKNISLERWTPEEIDKWLISPKGYLPGSSMFFNGIDNPEARRDVIAFLLIETR